MPHNHQRATLSKKKSTRVTMSELTCVLFGYGVVEVKHDMRTHVQAPGEATAALLDSSDSAEWVRYSWFMRRRHPQGRPVCYRLSDLQHDRFRFYVVRSERLPERMIIDKLKTLQKKDSLYYLIYVSLHNSSFRNLGRQAFACYPAPEHRKQPVRMNISPLPLVAAPGSVIMKKRYSVEDKKTCHISS